MSQPIAAWRVTYTPGNWVALAGPTSLAILQPAPARVSGLLNRFWDDILNTTSIQDLSAQLATHNLSQLASFALLFWDDNGLHAITRGAVTILDADTGQRLATGEGVVTWTETALGRDGSIRIDLEPVDAGSVLQLPLVVGGAAVSSVHLTTDPAALVHSTQVGLLGAGARDESDVPTDAVVAAVSVADESAPAPSADEDATLGLMPLPVPGVVPGMVAPMVAAPVLGGLLGDGEAASEPEYEQPQPIVVPEPEPEDKSGIDPEVEPERVEDVPVEESETEYVEDVPVEEPEPERAEDVPAEESEPEHAEVIDIPADQLQPDEAVEPVVPAHAAVEEPERAAVIESVPDFGSPEPFQVDAPEPVVPIVLDEPASDLMAPPVVPMHEDVPVEPVFAGEQPAEEPVVEPPLAEDDDSTGPIPGAVPAEEPVVEPPMPAVQEPPVVVPPPPAPPAQQVPTAPAHEGGLVSAVVCQLGHPNPPGAQYCRICQGPVGTISRLVPRPTLAVVRSSFGVSLDLSSPILIGRAPDTKGDLSVQVLKVPSPNTDISRSHLRVQSNGWQVEVIDLNSTNGSMLAVPGRAPFRMQPGVPTQIPLGSIVDLGDGIQIRLDPPR